MRRRSVHCTHGLCVLSCNNAFDLGLDSRQSGHDDPGNPRPTYLPRRSPFNLGCVHCWFSSELTCFVKTLHSRAFSLKSRHQSARFSLCSFCHSLVAAAAARYADERVVCTYISRTTRPNFITFSVVAAFGRGLAALQYVMYFLFCEWHHFLFMMSHMATWLNRSSLAAMLCLVHAFHVAVFVLCWSPYFVFNLLDTYGLLSSTSPQYKYRVSVFMQSLAPLNSHWLTLVNPSPPTSE